MCTFASFDCTILTIMRNKNSGKNTSMTTNTAVEVKEHLTNESIVKLDKPKKPTSLTKTPKIVETISGSDKSVVSFNSKSAPVKNVPEGSVSDRAARFNRFALSNNRMATRAMMEEHANELLGGGLIVLKGANNNEIAFEIEGVRLPTSGYYFTK